MTVISHKKKYVFIEVFKTGSRTVRRELMKNDSGAKQLTRIQNGAKTNHVEASWIKENIFPKKGLDWDEYFKFGFVRNPWDRELSNYFFNNKTLLPPEDVSFKEFLNAHLLKGGQIDASNVPQCEYLTDVNYVARFENYAEEVKNIYYKIGLAFPNSLKYTYKTEHKPYWEYYDDADIMKVHEWYEKDIEMYNYEFGE